MVAMQSFDSIMSFAGQGTVAGAAPQALGASTVPLQGAEAVAFAGACEAQCWSCILSEEPAGSLEVAGQSLGEELRKMSTRGFRSCGVGAATGAQTENQGPKVSRTSCP